MNDDELSPRMKDKLWAVGEALEEIREGQRERKTERLQLRVSPSEKAEVEQMTESLGVSAADYLMHLHRRALKELERKKARHGSGREGGERRGGRKRRQGGPGDEDGGGGVAAST